MKPIILASKSPRRKELLSYLPITFEIATKEVDEVLDPTLSPKENACALAKQKATAIASCYPDQVIIGCDTIVALENTLLGKPANEADAYGMLQLLSGKTHEVWTGVAVLLPETQHCISFAECTKVTMAPLSDQEIKHYIMTKEPMDKAGSYGIQGMGGMFIEKIEGSYFNVVGLPIQKLYTILKEEAIISL